MAVAAVAAFVLVCLGGPSQAAAAPGDPDLTFAGTGYGFTQSPLMSTGLNYDGEYLAVAEQADGKLVAAGGGNSGMYLVRHQADGSIDASFGEGGVAGLPYSDGRWEDVEIDASGNIFAVGDWVIDGNFEVLLAKYDADGNLDPTFASNGIFSWRTSASHYHVEELAIDASGRAVFGGEGSSTIYVGRLTTAGEWDTSFDGDGLAFLDITASNETFGGLAIDSTGRIGVSGSSTTAGADMFVLRLTSAGVLDTSFDGDGVAGTDTARGEAWTELLVDSSDRFVPVGYSVGSEREVTIGRYTTTGALDTTWAGDGVMEIDVMAGVHDDATGAALDASGNILVAGELGIVGNTDGFVLRVLATGGLDSSWSGDGIQTWDHNASHDVGWDLIATSSGRVVAAAEGLGSPNVPLLVGFTSAGVLDTTFSGDGFVDAERGTTLSSVADITVDSSDRTVVVASGKDNVVVTRFLADGSLDTSFGASGKTSFNVGLRSDGFAVTHDSSGRILVGGRREDFAGYHGFVSRLLSDGTLDPAFGSGGTAEFSQADRVDQLQEDSGGGIVVVGSGSGGGVIGRLDATGALDIPFGAAGGHTDSIYPGHTSSSFQDLAIDSAGRLVAAGSTSNGGSDVFVARYTSTGLLDTSFSGDGMQLYDTGTALDNGTAVAIRAGDGVMVGGSAGGFGSTDFRLVAFDASGALDTAFSGDGVETVTAYDDYLDDIVIDGGGNILASGYTRPFSGQDQVMVVRLAAAGGLDTTWDGDGKAFYHLHDLVRAQGAGIGLDSQQRILVGARIGSASGNHIGVLRLESCTPVPPCDPSNVAPSTWATTLNPSLQGSAYTDPESDPHLSSQWQVRTDAGTYALPVEDSGEDFVNLESYPIASALTEGATYWFRVRYRDDLGNWSGYSAETSFTVDTLAPTLGDVDYPDGESDARPDVTFADGADATSGVDASGTYLERRTASYLGGGSCGVFGGWGPVGGIDPASPYTDTSATPGNCYEYRYVVPDNAGNVATFTSANTFQMIPDTTPPSVPQGRRLYDRGGTTTVTVQWDQASDNLTAPGNLVYDVDGSSDGISWASLCTDQPDVPRRCQQGGLTDAQPIYFRIRAQDEAGNVGAWGYYADAANTRLYLREGLSSAFLTGAAVKRVDPAGAVFASTTTPNLNGSTDYIQFLPGGTATSSVSLPASINPSPSGQGWFVDQGAGDGTYPGGINDGPVRVVWETTAAKTSGTAYALTRVFTTATSGGNAVAPTSTPNDVTGSDNVFLGAPVAHSNYHDIHATPQSWGLGESLYFETWLDITVASGSAGGGQTVDMTGAPSIELPLPGVRPTLATSLAPATGYSGPAAPTLQADYQHPGAIPGHLVFEVCIDDGGGGCGTLVDTGYSAFEIAPAATGSYTPVEAGASGVSYVWRVRSEDRQGRISAWSAYRTYAVTAANQAPDVPSHVTPADAATTTDTTPALTATFSDPDGADTGQLHFEICDVAMAAGQTCAGAGGTPQASGSSAAGIANGSNGSWTVGSALADGTYHWNVHAEDGSAATSSRSASWQLTISSTSTSMDVTGCAGAAIDFGTLLPGNPHVAGSDCSIGFSATGATSSLRISQTDGAGRAMTGPSTILDYGEAGGAWGGTNLFGACLRSATNSTATWTTSGTCAPADGPEWNGIATAADEVATGADGVSGTANVRFGTLLDATDSPGAYSAQVTIEVVVP